MRCSAMPSWLALTCAAATVVVLLLLWGVICLRRVRDEVRRLRETVERLLPPVAPTSRIPGLPRRPSRRRFH